MFKKGNKFGYKPCKEEIKKRFSKERMGKDNPNWKGTIKKFTCLECEKEFLGYEKERKYCSKKCSGESEIHKNILSKTHLGKIGNKASNWQGGKTKGQKLRMLKKYKNWRSEVLKRDNFACCICFKVGEELEAHHIKSWAKYPKLRYKISNGITLCKKCHKQIHKK